MDILLTNDDGIHAAGLEVLLRGLAEGLNIVVAAPPSEKSASSHSISLRRKLRVEEFEKSGFQHFCIHGTPADCVKFVLSEVQGFSPDLVLSGINQGTNTGVSVYYSGTISAAREGLINRIPAIAISLCGTGFGDFSVAVDVTRQLVEGYRLGIIPKDIMLNVNVPAIPQSEIQGVKVTKQASSRFVEEFILQGDDQGAKIYTLGGQIETDEKDGASDEEAIAQGFISITPLKLDLTDYDKMPVLEKWIGKGQKKK